MVVIRATTQLRCRLKGAPLHGMETSTTVLGG